MNTRARRHTHAHTHHWHRYTSRVDGEKRRLTQLLADLSKLDSRLDHIKEKPRWEDVEIQEEKQVHSLFECQFFATLNP